MCISVYLERKYEMKDNSPWYLETYGPNKELRIFFAELLNKCLGMKSGTGEINDIDIKYISTQKRPFTNTFNKLKLTNNIFTHKVCCDFLELALIKNSVKKAVEIIQTSKYGIYCNSLKTCNFKQMDQCHHIKKNKANDYCECINSVLTEGSFLKNTCGTCPIKLIYDILPHIENECRNRFLNKKEIQATYTSADEEALLSKIYDDIQTFEHHFDSKQLDTDKICKLFNSCIQCVNISDVSDIKLAYVKWYTARLCTWPYFKSCLLQLYRYDESIIYVLLRSASAICKSIDITKSSLKLFCNIEIDKITAYISLAYQNPFAMNYCETPEDILENCFRIIQAQPEEYQLLSLYTEMWNLAFHTQKNPDIYEAQIKHILQKQSYNNKGERYYVYSYLYGLCNYKKPKLLLFEKAKQLRQCHCYNDTLDITIELFLNKAFHDDEFFESGNPALDILNMKNYGTLDKITTTDIPTSPALYQRIYGDNTLLKYFEEYRKIH